MSELLDSVWKKKGASIMLIGAVILALQLAGKALDLAIPEKVRPEQVEHYLQSSEMCREFRAVPHEHDTQLRALLEILETQKDVRRALQEITITQIQIQAALEK
jgi:hypothetical protein